MALRGACLTDDVLGDERRQLGAQLLLQLVHQFVDDGVKSQRDAALSRRLLDGAADPDVEAVNRP